MQVSPGPNCPTLEWRFCIIRAEYVVVVDVQKQPVPIDPTHARGTVRPLHSEGTCLREQRDGHTSYHP